MFIILYLIFLQLLNMGKEKVPLNIAVTGYVGSGNSTTTHVETGKSTTTGKTICGKPITTDHPIYGWPSELVAGGDKRVA